VKSHLTFDHFGHQPVEGAAASRQLLEYVCAFGLLAESALQGIDLAADFANAEEEFVTVFFGVRHLSNTILEYSFKQNCLSYWHFHSHEFKAPIACQAASKYDVEGDISGVHTTRWTALRLLAVLVAVAVLSFGLQAAGHWHSRTFEDQHCRVCHFAHSVAVDFSHGNALPLPEVVNRLAVNPSFEPALEVVVHRLSSRGPPSA
jgi:hypothetical protein